mmetsp:Transcript_19708/g.43878  ORF Transcript_19708/g.43878 Transcript_19708/m.43878 type:complete len:492 (+) Transcript_19708:40-1515(+)
MRWRPRTPVPAEDKAHRREAKAQISTDSILLMAVYSSVQPEQSGKMRRRTAEHLSHTITGTYTQRHVPSASDDDGIRILRVFLNRSISTTVFVLLTLLCVHTCTCASFVRVPRSKFVRVPVWKHPYSRDFECKSCTVALTRTIRPVFTAASSTSSDNAGVNRSSPPIEPESGGSITPESTGNDGQSRRDLLSVGAHLLGCVAAATAVSTYEDYDVTHLKPNRATLRQSYLASSADGDSYASIIGSATRGLAWNKSDRQPDIYELQFGEQAGRDIESYNEVMEHHRRERVPMWKKDGTRQSGFPSSNIDVSSNMSEETVKDAVVDIYNALRAVLTLKVLAIDYGWDEMATVMDSRTLTSNLERATQTLRSAKPYLADDARDTIGFDWGSCAWRHCGAAADAQESLAELKCRLGLFEPFECLFCLDIVERSLRDIVAVIPEKLKPKGNDGVLEEYVPYQPRSEDEGNFEGDGDESEFLGALSALRNDLLSFGQ